MLLVSEATLSAATATLVSATHNFRTTDGKQFHLGTIDATRMRMAALTALSILAGTAVDTSVDHLPPRP